ncbi:MAG: hypothetical protein ABIH50_01820 [bacterium]
MYVGLGSVGRKIYHTIPQVARPMVRKAFALLNKGIFYPPLPEENSANLLNFTSQNHGIKREALEAAVKAAGFKSVWEVKAWMHAIDNEYDPAIADFSASFQPGKEAKLDNIRSNVPRNNFGYVVFCIFISRIFNDNRSAIRTFSVSALTSHGKDLFAKAEKNKFIRQVSSDFGRMTWSVIANPLEVAKYRISNLPLAVRQAIADLN